MDFKSLPEVLIHFKKEETAIEYFENIRWGGTPVCPHCGSVKTYTTNRGHKCGNNTCYKKFTVRIGTIFEESKLPLKTWFAAIYLCTSRKKGISSCQLARDLGITQKTGWFVLHRIREMLKNGSVELLSGTVEADETYVGGKEKNRHKKKKRSVMPGKENECNDGSVYNEKKIVIGVLERSGKVALKHVPNATTENIIPFIKANVKEGAKMMTDEHYSYAMLPKTYTHKTVKHCEKVYALGNIHINGMENFWSLLKRGIYGTYHQISGKHTHRYLNEFAGRFNTRKITDSDRFNQCLGQYPGRLTYNRLIDKKCQAAPIKTI